MSILDRENLANENLVKLFRDPPEFSVMVMTLTALWGRDPHATEAFFNSKSRGANTRDGPCFLLENP